MAYKIRDLRNLDENLYNFIASGISSNGYTVLSGFDSAWVTSGVYLLDSYPSTTGNLKIPTVAVDHINTSENPLQIGGGREDRVRFRIEIYGTSKGSRDDLSEMIRLMFKVPMTIWDLNEFYADGSYVQLGQAEFENVTMFPIHGDGVQRALQYRMSINLDCLVTIPSGTSLITT